MKIIIVGAGEIGRHLAERLSSESHQIVIVEEEDALCGELSAHLDAKVIKGDGSSVNVLIDAGIDDCDLFLALTSSNNTNLVACSIAKEFRASKVICRVDPEIQRTAVWFDYKRQFGIDYMFSSERLAATELCKFIRNPETVSVEEIGRGSIEMQQIRVQEKSVVAGKMLLEMGFPERVRVGAIERENKLIIPRAKDRLQPGDVVTVIGEPRKLEEISGKLGTGLHQDSFRVVIFGGGEYGYALAEMLSGWNNCRVRVMEKDAALCERLSSQLDDVTVLNIDATSISELREEQVGEADFFIATTSDDEDNVMTCLQAHHLGATRCLTLIHRADYADSISSFGERIGIKAAVSPREATRQELMRFVTSDRYHVVKNLQNAQVLEANVVETSAVAGSAVSQIAWPEGCLLVGLLHGTKAFVPAATDIIEPGDNIYAVVSHAAKKPFLKLLKPNGKPRPSEKYDSPNSESESAFDSNSVL